MGQGVLLDAQQWTALYRPRYPLASDDLRMGSGRTTRARALGMRYLEHSPAALQTMFVIDVDHRDTLVRALGLPRHHPEPSWVAESVSGRGHVGWVLQTPVCRTDAARQAPLLFAAKVQEGLRRAMDGDPGYAGVLTKNPTHDGWATTWGRAEPWELRDLAHALGELMPRSMPRRTPESTGLGRNVTLFNNLRMWSYPRRQHYGDRAEWEGVVEAMATVYNDFPTPLDLAEVQATARSVARWTWRKLTPESFRAVQAERGRKGNAASSATGGQRRAALAGVAAGNPSKGGRANTPAQREARLRNLPTNRVDRAAVLEVLT